MEFRLLGPLEVVVDDRTLAMPRGRARSLLALLALHPRQVLPTDRLVEELWGGQPPRTAVTALQGLVSTLRKRLERTSDGDGAPTVLVTHAPGYVLAVDRDQVDVHFFRRLVGEAIEAPAEQQAHHLRAALALWRGPALVDFTYEPFAQAHIAALDELRLTALESRLDADLALGRHAEVVAELDELVAAHPLREALRAHLMVALYRSGRQGDALEVYRAARRQLVDELGVEPGPQLQALERAILAQDASLDPPGKSVSLGPSSRQGRVLPGPGAWLRTSRRTVTVVFAEITTRGPESSGAVDAEALQPLVSRAHATARAVVEQHGGMVEGVLGDVVVAVFGMPVAQEDDAARAVRAATELRQQVDDLHVPADGHPGIRLVARTGVDTGEVVVGDATPSAASGQPAANASRLQRAASDGEVLLGESTRRLIQDAVLVEPIDLAEAGSGGAAWRLVEMTPERPGLPASDTTHVGRRDELQALRRSLDAVVRDRHATLVTVIGDAGVGKSRLAQAFADAIAGEARVVAGRCRAYGEGITYWPMREIVQDLTAGTGEAGLARLLGAEPHGRSNAEQVAVATGLSDRPIQRPADLFLAVRQVVEVAAAEAPLVIVVDDVHWAQPTFLDLLEYLAESVAAPVLLLCLARPDLTETRPGWASAVGPSTTVELPPLGTADSRELVTRHLGGRLLAPESMGRILARGQGNPQFLEHLLAALGSEGEEGAIPPTVQALLTARLDRLGPAERDVLRCASVIGEDVPIDGLTALLPADARPHLDRHVDVLEAKHLVRRVVDGRSGDAGLAFRHMLIQQAAYRTLTHAARADLHARVAAWLEQEAGTSAVEEEALVGLHLERAVRHRRYLGGSDDATEALAVRAGERLANAGLRAYDRFDVPAAENLLSRSRALLPPDHPRRMPVLRRLTEAYPVMGRPSDAADCFDELLDLVGRDADDTMARGVHLEQLRFQLIAGPDPVPMNTIQREVEKSLAAFQAAGDEVLVSQAHYLLASVHLRLGRMDELAEVAWAGIDRARQAGELRERLGAPWWVVFHLLHGPTPVEECIQACEEVMDVGGVNHLGVVAALGHFRAMSGDTAEGRRMVGRARDLLRERIRLPRPLSFIGQQQAGVELLAGDVEAATHALNDALDVALRITERDQAAQIAARLSLVQSDQGALDEAARLATLATDQAPAEDVMARGLADAARARVRAAQGDGESAVHTARQALGRIPVDMLPLRALLHATLADVLASAGDHEAADESTKAALTLHERKGNVVGAARSRERLGAPRGRTR